MRRAHSFIDRILLGNVAHKLALEGVIRHIYLKCNFCDKIVKWGLTRMKEHLPRSHKNVSSCVVDEIGEQLVMQVMRDNTSAYITVGWRRGSTCTGHRALHTALILY